MSIEALRKGEYPGSDIFVEQTLSSGSNYKRYITSYKSEGLKIYGLLTVPNGTSPEGGWPVIIFNHGYISPSIYKTTEKYIAYQDALALAGYTTFKSDYRGHGNSEGNATGGYGSNAYTIDVLNAVSSIKRLKNPENPSTPVDRSGLIVDADRIGMWGHSMGGSITLKSMVTTKDIKAGVIWAGVVGSYPDLIERWRRRSGPTPTISTNSQRGRWRRELVDKYGDPSQNPQFWNSISANSYLSDISGPLQLHHGTLDASVPIEFSRTLEKQMTDVNKAVELYEYTGDDHNLSKNLSLALSRSVDFFDQYLK
ncbi:peptidase [Candidatus Woesebacteria bacterium RIFCSPLOWO2_01_FULL_39_61]|uniref:Peptidase n=1 Tax=Candidatus Woesebacteria bacterium RIFCSPHIGHO2_02_FULL_39_13 TaxID=1802505 RepID=A0A1F7Z4Q8_9BACT|nr:MAG: peptidase [Candidatus Woesebacteria bacterium RIFCSPHIGHO2_01_FULL_39_95]OGM34079.1 MAG: peptidase [Candidatus Woesebacteria bacterium RIFCSPHIGHO2_02_FULL_39_13]OGM38338.1 MAG: peptidase [Candidatus Woesebacteria bacterium RIFCSPHIGHO2_12_FULL_40_20]OGM66994.1 MAG: peptidase [Candidatus Woesebacteria bacterium RIFCSPLOWO2_01_FULL_39_61]OGM74850.1 MAG: peptidase [Candidatus Woesebacteria bacterium RIFCSPLOWO2_12_FULL_39_9]